MKHVSVARDLTAKNKGTPLKKSLDDLWECIEDVATFGENHIEYGINCLYPNVDKFDFKKVLEDNGYVVNIVNNNDNERFHISWK